MSGLNSDHGDARLWRVERLERCDAHGRSRVSARVEGKTVWFESGDVPLAKSPEAFAAAFLVPALAQGTKIVMEEEVDGAWMDSVERLLPVWNRWWGYPRESPVVCARSAHKLGQPVPRAGACFTGGVDSFYTALRGRHPIDAMIFVHGFDIPLKDTGRMAAFEPVLRRVAKTLGKTSVVVRTNLRLHPCFAGVNWERSHGAALAATAHVLQSYIGRLIIPSTYAYRSTGGWGSHWMTDAFWSSAAMNIVHDDATLSRREKLLRIASEPLLWDSLRVCWENRRPSGNCSRCEKCLRTMVALEAAGQLRHYTVFDQGVSLSARLDRLPFIPPHLLRSFRNLRRERVPPDVRTALTRLIRRTRIHVKPSALRRAVRCAKRLVHPGQGRC